MPYTLLVTAYFSFNLGYLAARWRPLWHRVRRAESMSTSVQMTWGLTTILFLAFPIVIYLELSQWE